MKILVVSAHFPPNFVSGGTLAPQRQARGLRALGHDVSVYAGWLGDRPGLEVWSEVDETGLPVRWVSSRAWIGWDDRNNFDNPGVTDDFRSHVAEVQPDVVHFHSMQSLGAGLLDVAADAGAKVVVTMHDFWWFCARQFLVDRDYHPCCLVVSCGDCPCQIDRDWLAGRNQFLADRLARADLILAVSSSSAEVLAANGIESARLRIDENGVPAPAAGEQANGVDARPAAEAAPESAATDGGTGVRFTYAGGPDRMKGVHVLIEAARLLTDRHGSAGWTIRAYGVGPYLEESGEHVENLPFDARPAFDPQDAEAVFAATDVLVVPSVMRETYSILTREALARRVPVITTDTIGPEEVVEHGRNGLVVAADDAVGLAGAMAQVVDDPHLLATLRRGCAGLVVRSVEEQVAGLDLLYQGLLAPPPAPVPARAEIRRVVFMAGIEGAPLRYRARLPAEGLAMLAIESAVRHYRSADLPGLLEEA
ncbi:MAG: hypothetical protein QOG64_1582, partial [Acidimicrobiaceae bacterium]|nr:hypothetical protein [Acidimicrobiaceae bacterium]